MESYTDFAFCYDRLTENVDYKSRAEHICQIMNQCNHDPGVCLDLACGTGNITLELAKRGIDVFGVDGSPEMLSVAQQKLSEHGYDVLLICQMMQNLELYSTVDTVICCLDSINHITDPKDVQSTFDGVSKHLNSNGYFIFDVNTIYKHRNVLSNNTFVYDVDDVFCVWQNDFEDETNIVTINLDLFEPDGDAYYRSSEEFCERAYSIEQLVGMLERSGFEVVGIYDDMSFNKPKQDSERIIFVARKK